MNDMNFSEAVERSIQIRKLYHQIERQNLEKEWSVEGSAPMFRSIRFHFTIAAKENFTFSWGL